MAVAKDDKPTFRCKFCGHLEDLGAAGENTVPLACSVCGSGVTFHPRTGQKFSDPNNWEILASLDSEVLASHGLKPDEVGTPREDGIPIAQGAPVIGRMLTATLEG